MDIMIKTGKYSSKERVSITLNRGVPDRVPIDYMANPGIDRRLKQRLSLKPDDDDGLRQALGVDFIYAGAPYTGPRLHAEIPGKKVDPSTGFITQWIEHEKGGYWDHCDFPLKEADEDAIAAWPLPSPDDFDYQDVHDKSRQSKYAVYVAGGGLPDIINSNGRLRGMEQVLIDLVSEDPAGLLLIKRRAELYLEITARTIEAAKGAIDFLWIGEDLGTQKGPMISLELFRRHIRPIHQQYIDLAKSFGLPVMIHSCGSSSWAFEDFIEMGIDAVDTLQPEAHNMAPEYLKKTFGNRLAFHGCISTAGPVANGTPEEVTESCRKTLEIMMPGGGYCFSPTHCLQDNSPEENVLAMYRAAHEYGWY
jgi:hypothetical protein